MREDNGHEYHNHDCNQNHEPHDQKCGHDHARHGHGCGCGHGHDHAHHEHEHEHGHSHDGPDYLVEEQADGLHLTIMAHEEALVASLTLDLLGESERVGECVGAALEELVADLEASGAMIGHVKAALSRVTPIMLFNSVGGGVTGKTCRGDAYRFELAAIVFFVDQEKLLSTVQDVVKQLT